MKAIRITVQTEPIAKGRPRVTFKDGKVRTYTPTKTLEAQEFLQYRLSRHKTDMFPAHIPIKLTAVFYRTKSKWLPSKEKLPFRKPDTDNMLKWLLDSLNGVLIVDDAQITSINVKKRWAENGVGYLTIKLEEDKL